MAVGCVVIAAFVEATQQALTGAPTVANVLPSFLSSGLVNYVPLALISIAVFLWIIGARAPANSNAGVASVASGEAPKIQRILDYGTAQEMNQWARQIEHEWEESSISYREFVKAWNDWDRLVHKGLGTTPERRHELGTQWYDEVFRTVTGFQRRISHLALVASAHRLEEPKE